MISVRMNNSCECSWKEVVSEHLVSEVVSSLFFLSVIYSRSSLLDGHPVLASASSAGHIALWDLNEGGRLLHMIRCAHDAAISSIEWVPGQPVLITSSEDNSVKVSWQVVAQYTLLLSHKSNGSSILQHPLRDS